MKFDTLRHFLSSISWFNIYEQT